MMNITVAAKDKDVLVLRITGAGASYVNALRRYMLTRVPVLAIENVEIRKNNSALYDEIIAHRLGMLSISTDNKSYNLTSECKCKGAGCAQCQVKMTLKAKGPSMVCAEDIVSADPKAKPVHDKTPIAKLLEGHELELEAVATKGEGEEHSKWNPGLIYYKEYPHIKIQKQPENAQQLAEKYSEILEYKAGKLVVKEKELLYYDVHEAVASESKGAITISYEDDYVFTIETWHQLETREIVTSALERFNKDLGELQTLVKEV